MVAKFGPKMSEIAKFVDNGNKFALPVKALFTGKLGKPVLPVFTNFYRYKFTTLLPTSSLCLSFKFSPRFTAEKKTTLLLHTLSLSPKGRSARWARDCEANATFENALTQISPQSPWCIVWVSSVEEGLPFRLHSHRSREEDKCSLPACRVFARTNDEREHWQTHCWGGS